MDDKSVGGAPMVGSYGLASVQFRTPAAAAAILPVAGSEDLYAALVGALSASFPDMDGAAVQEFADELRAALRPPELSLRQR